MVTTRSTAVKRPHGIPGTQNQEELRAVRQVIERHGPVRQRRSLPLEEQQPALQAADVKHSPTGTIPAEQQSEDALPLQRLKQRQEEPAGIALLPRASSTLLATARDAEDDGDEQDEPQTQGLYDDQDGDEQLSEEPYEENRSSMRTRDIPEDDRESSDEARFAERRASSYVTQRSQQYPAPSSRTRETGGKYPTTSPKLIPASQLGERRSTYRKPQPPQANVTRQLPPPRHPLWSAHPLVYLGIVVLLGVLAYIYVFPWAHDQYDTIRYRNPRIDYTYATLSGDTSSHQSLITTVNKKGELIVTIYPGDNKAPIALQFQPLVTDGAVESPGTIDRVIPVKAGIDDIEISFNGSTLILEYANHTLKRIM